MKIEITVPWTEGEQAQAQEAAQSGNAGPLRNLCRKEAEHFEDVIKMHPEYSDGLVKIERLAVEGYLYQKLRGHLDEATQTSSILEEREDGST